MVILFMLSLMIDDIWTRKWSLASFCRGGWRRQKIAGHDERVEGNELHAFILLMEEIHELARKWCFILWMVHDGSWLFIGILRHSNYPFQSSHIVNPLMLDKNLKQLKFSLISNRPAVICSCNSLAKGPTWTAEARSKERAGSVGNGTSLLPIPNRNCWSLESWWISEFHWKKPDGFQDFIWTPEGS